MSAPRAPRPFTNDAGSRRARRRGARLALAAYLACAVLFGALLASAASAVSL